VHPSQLSNESKYPCDEHIPGTTELKQLSAYLCPLKMTMKEEASTEEYNAPMTLAFSISIISFDYAYHKEV
jgi:hypothetical protein